MSRKRSRSASRSRDEGSVSGEEKKKKIRPAKQVITSMVNEQKRSRVGSYFVIGNNDLGQLGGKDDNVSEPVELDSLHHVNTLDFATGYYFNVVVEANNNEKHRRVYCWGGVNYSIENHKPVKTDDFPTTPTAIKGLTRKFIVQAVAGEAHAAVLTLDGEVFAWGIYKSLEGDLGFGPERRREIQETPEEIEGLPEPCIQIACNANRTLALTQGGEVFQWGDTKVSGEQRRASRQNPGFITPSLLRFPAKLKALFCSVSTQIFGVGRDGKVYACGNDNSWQLGINVQKDFEMPPEGEDAPKKDTKKKKEEDPKKKKTAKDDKGTEGQEGDAPKKRRPKRKNKKENYVNGVLAKAINELNLNVKKICGGEKHTLLLTDEGEVYSWGGNDVGQLGLGVDDDVVKEPRKIDFFEDKAVDIGCGLNYSVVVNSDGEVLGFGALRDAGLPASKDIVSTPINICEAIKDFKIESVSCAMKHILIFGKRDE